MMATHPRTAPAGDEVDDGKHARRHVKLGWWALATFSALGLVLETMHGFKIGWYLDARHETRRLLLTLAHAHGTVLAIIQVVFGLYLKVFAPPQTPRLRLGSHCLAAATVLLPTGFFLGGVLPYAGDPGFGVLIVPLAAPLLLIGVAVIALSVR